MSPSLLGTDCGRACYTHYGAHACHIWCNTGKQKGSPVRNAQEVSVACLSTGIPHLCKGTSPTSALAWPRQLHQQEVCPETPGDPLGSGALEAARHKLGRACGVLDILARLGLQASRDRHCT